MNARAFGIRLQYADASARRLIVEALREKANTDRIVAGLIESGAQPHSDEETPRANRVLELRTDADFGEQIAREFENV